MTAGTPMVLRASPQGFIEISSIEEFADGSGYVSRLSVGSGRFTCSEHPFYFDNLKGFITSLTKAYERVEGRMRLAHAYEKDFVEIEILGTGHVVVSGVVVESDPPRQELRFAFQCDQTFLPELLRSMNQVGKELKWKH
ncbi:MAG: hypothetical protein HY301_02225 [Verrucomicrobia bacterium]|nr:hypothetical protein [Verrucomicrobiota bacterium]